MSKFLILAAGITFPATMALAASQAVEPVAPKMICKKDRQGADLGSNLRRSGKRICKTRVEWDEMERNAKETLRRIEDSALRVPAESGRGN